MSFAVAVEDKGHETDSERQRHDDTERHCHIARTRHLLSTVKLAVSHSPSDIEERQGEYEEHGEDSE